MLETKKRILQFVEFKRLSKRKFCEKTELSHTIFNNDSAIGSDKLEKIYNVYPELNIDWVITGRGEMEYKLHQEKSLSLNVAAEDPAEYIRAIVREELDKVAVEVSAIARSG